MQIGEKSKFFFINLLKGLLWFAIIITIFFIFKNYLNIDYEKWLEPVFANVTLIFIVYVISELVFGILPPELFMIWALRTENIFEYSFLIAVFAALSYMAGFAGFLFGAYLNRTLLFRYLRKRYLGKYHSMLQKYGVFLILVAALTPLPFSAISMLVGSLKYPVNKYLLYSFSRFIRFAVYAAIIWNANIF